MSESFVIDANVIAFAAGAHGEDEQNAACLNIVSKIMLEEDLCFALDTEGKILGEYKSNLSNYKNPHTKLIQEYIEKQLKQKDGITFHIPEHESEVEELKAKGFHDDDLIFVRVAPKTSSQTITSCDSNSFLDDEYKDWIESELGVSVFPPEEFNPSSN
ncbi:hypothetical protein NGM10_00925 [Halorussus salilacus]|uniref:hypothetical protein n=1 Tax=Halorussus salilacus TaxID=2953750 RepID=UPI0020A09202|nr:hypothetical protein [Halorussus salilacus]USZ68319.1 hypothetical protein NGM10_00925 [Halorussus salilacus]